MKKNKKNGFTLIEIIVSLFIIGLIITIANISINKIREKGRDVKRIDNIKQIQLALEMYRRDVGSYPETLNFGEQLVNPSNSNIVYLDKIPTNLFYKGNNCPNEEYAYTLDDGKYEIEFCLENFQTEIESNYNCATVSGIKNEKCFNPFECGDLLSYAGKSYTTIQIGDQCWFQENLNIGTMISGLENQTNNSIIEKYCYNNDINNCNVYGGLYKWNEAMNHNTSILQGICPDDWHIPTDSDWIELGNFIDSENYTPLDGPIGSPEDIGGFWNNAKIPLVPTSWGGNNSSGFTALPAGGCFDPNDFTELNNQTWFWSSSEYNPNKSWISALLSDPSAFFRYSEGIKEYGISIRCLKNSD